MASTHGWDTSNSSSTNTPSTPPWGCSQSPHITLPVSHISVIAPIQLQEILPLCYTLLYSASLIILKNSVHLWVTGNKEKKTLLEKIKSMALRMTRG